MAELKTFVFTDIVRSVDLKGEMPGHSDAERDQAFIQSILTPHRERIERDLESHGGRVVSTAGDGHFLVFSDTTLAARWAVRIQECHRDEPIRTPRENQVAVRISIHLGIPQIDPRDENNFVGKTVDYAARLCDCASGEQILVSRSVVAILEDAGMDGVSFHFHGPRDLKGIGKVEIHELLHGKERPRKPRNQPNEGLARQWTVLPATMGLTEFQASKGNGGSSGNRMSGTSVAPAKLGNYVLGERLGSGGMGDVYKAKHSQFDRVRAVKVIKQHFVDTGHREVVRRFYQEIKAVGALDHPNIVVAIDSSMPTDAVHYLVMEYIDGVSTEELVTQFGPLEVADACEIARQTAHGLQYILQHGMVHRDIKPSNLMLTVRGESGSSMPLSSGSSSWDQPGGEATQAVVKILDLGLALLVEDDQQRLTRFDDQAMGTAMYMSPEQWKTTSVDIRADIYSLGCTLYHLLAGEPPFWQSDLRPEKAHEREPLPPIKSIPAPLWNILQKMTARNLADRYANPSEVAMALAPLAKEHDLPKLAAQFVKRPAAEETRQNQNLDRMETYVSAPEEVDTLLGHAPHDPLHAAPQAVPNRAGWWMAIALALVATAGLLSWLVFHTTEQIRKDRQKNPQHLQFAADRASDAVIREIHIRFDILKRLAKDRYLGETMEQIDKRPEEETLWLPLQNWLGARDAQHDTKAPANSWFLVDRRGIQIARSPPSRTSLGHSYAHRDYFHGQGSDLPEGTSGVDPIDQPTQSAVYRSTSTGRLRVAFAVPIVGNPRKETKRGPAQHVLGVLAMSVDLGDFNVLENRLPRGYEVVLIDMRDGMLEGESRRGLILHHQAREESRKGRPPLRVGKALLAQIDRLLEASHSDSWNQHELILSEYRDLAVTRKKRYWGALHPVIDQQPSGAEHDTGWLVLVQEPMGE